MNRQVNPDHCYTTDDGTLYMLESAHGALEWHIVKDGRTHRTFTSLTAAKGWLEHVLTYPQADKGHVIVGGHVSAGFKAKLAAALKGDAK